jgi:beta-lactamase class A
MRRLLLILTVLIVSLGSFASVQPTQAAPTQEVDLIGLMDNLEAYLREAKFNPGTTRQGSIYLYDLKTRNEFAVNGEVRYSAASVSKLYVMMMFFQRRTVEKPQMTLAQANLLAKMMLCSDNAATNELIKIIGDGDLEKGLAYLRGASPYMGFLLDRQFTGNGAPLVVDGTVDPQDADADPHNYMYAETPALALKELVWCSQKNTETYGGQNFDFDVADCKKMVALMRANKILNLIEGGIPEGIPVAHKQGWVEDTHGDAAYISTPGGDYILVIFLHQRKFLMHTGSFPVMAEISRRVYNAYNPKAPLKEIRSQPIPQECTIPPGLIAELMK